MGAEGQFTPLKFIRCISLCSSCSLWISPSKNLASRRRLPCLNHLPGVTRKIIRPMFDSAASTPSCAGAC